MNYYSIYFSMSYFWDNSVYFFIIRIKLSKYHMTILFKEIVIVLYGEGKTLTIKPPLAD